jgi:hypothetical protein
MDPHHVGIMSVNPRQIQQAAQGTTDIVEAIANLQENIYESLTALGSSVGTDWPGTQFNNSLVKPMLKDTADTLDAVRESISTMGGLVNEMVGLYARADQAASEIAGGTRIA